MNLEKLEYWKEKYRKGQPVEDIKISDIQYNNNITFPKIYVEFLKLAGEYCAAVVQNHEFEFIENYQQDAQKWLKEYDLENLIKKPFWVIATDGDSESFWYFHLDEGDNPAIYRLSCMYYGEVKDKLAFGKVADSFQAWIEKAIDYFEEDPENQ